MAPTTFTTCLPSPGLSNEAAALHKKPAYLGFLGTLEISSVK